MPWQRQVADVALEIDPATGRLAYRTVILTIPRQCGKTTLLLSVWLQRALGWERQNIAWTMQNAKDAREKWEDEHVPQIEQSPLRRAVQKVRRQNGSEAVIFRNGSIQRLMSSTMSSGHGKTLDLGIVDEAFAQPDDRLEQAMRPAMRTRPQPQMWLVSTMGTADSVWFHSWCDAGRAAVDSGSSSVAYFEWSADPSADPGDPETWWSCTPALGHTISESTIRGDYEAAKGRPDGMPGFLRGSLNIPTADNAQPAFSAAEWNALRDNDSNPAGRVVFSVDVAPGGESTSIAVCGLRSDGLAHVELVDNRPGVDWVEGRRRELDERHRPKMWVRDPAGPAVELAGKFRDLSGRERMEACTRMATAVRDGGLRWVCDMSLDAAVAAAVAGGRRRDLGDGNWTWSRKSSDVDISPLVAMTSALWAAPLVRRQRAVML